MVKNFQTKTFYVIKYAFVYFIISEMLIKKY